GINGICLSERKGKECEQPVCSPSKNCNNHGICKPVMNCKATCQCFRQWMGNACEIRNPRVAWGDPHLETLDGRAFDYFGIVKFWGCISPSLSYQYRFYAYKTTSFIGAIVIKVGNSSVLTVTTKLNITADDFPSLRLDGSLIDNLNSNHSYKFDNDTIRLDISPKSSLINKKDPTILITSVKYNSGSSISVITSFSEKMKCQYLSLSITGSEKMFNQTSGICGVMNDEDSDDFKGPNGENFTSHIDFVESWRMTSTYRQNRGLLNTWSFHLSNFHKDDVMDSSYTLSSHKPIYSLKYINQSKIDLASELCAGDDVNEDDKKRCIYDVVMSDDPSIAKQGILTLKQCKNQCSNRGTCQDKVCVCIDGWSGEYCEIGFCDQCVNGNCSEGFCSCFKGFEGSTCEIEAFCEGNCSSRGICVKTGVCECEIGWTGNNCSEVAICQKGCSNHGVCIDHDKCKCEVGYTGPTCLLYSCENMNYCTNHGSCLGFDECLCEDGWKGDACSIAICEKDCSLNGECIAPNKCLCNNGFHGDYCEHLKSCPDLMNCNGHGICKNETECICDSGFTGRNCSVPECDPPYSLNGTCISANECKCDLGFEGMTCSEFSCESLNFCSGRGSYISFDNCSCDLLWYGPKYSETSCKNQSNCSGNGICVAPNVCKCKNGFTGEDCSEKAVPNIDKPQFLSDDYTVVVDELISNNEYLLQIQANDTDIGSTKGIFYSLGFSNISVTIDEITGVLQSNVEFKPGSYNVEVVAMENTLSKLSSSASVTINVEDVNKCAVIKHPVLNDKILLNSSIPQGSLVLRIDATDLDYGLKGELTYKLEKTEKESNIFEVRGNSTEIVTVKYPLPVGRFEHRLIALDKSDDPCSSTSTFVVYIQQGEEVEVTTVKPEDGTISKSIQSTLPNEESTLNEFSTEEDTDFTTKAFSNYLTTSGGEIIDTTSYSQTVIKKTSEMTYLIIAISSVGVMVSIAILTFLFLFIKAKKGKGYI
ncbi:unnamed protein product, partial [Dimorphilus gyrociliatus]